MKFGVKEHQGVTVITLSFFTTNYVNCPLKYGEYQARTLNTKEVREYS